MLFLLLLFCVFFFICSEQRTWSGENRWRGDKREHTKKPVIWCLLKETWFCIIQRKMRITHHQCKSVHMKWTRKKTSSSSSSGDGSNSSICRSFSFRILCIGYMVLWMGKKTWAHFFLYTYISVCSVYVHWNEHKLSFQNKKKLNTKCLWSV